MLFFFPFFFFLIFLFKIDLKKRKKKKQPLSSIVLHVIVSLMDKTTTPHPPTLTPHSTPLTPLIPHYSTLLHPNPSHSSTLHLTVPHSTSLNPTHHTLSTPSTPLYLTPPPLHPTPATRQWCVLVGSRSSLAVRL